MYSMLSMIHDLVSILVFFCVINVSRDCIVNTFLKKLFAVLVSQVYEARCSLTSIS